MKKYKDLLESLNQRRLQIVETPVEEVNSLREAYVEEKIFNVGDTVETNTGDIAEIIDRGPNYVTLIKEGNTFKKWLKDVKPVQVEENAKRRSQIYKESFIIKGYKTKNFNRKLSEKFRDIAGKVGDTYALYNSVVCFDSLLGLSEDNLKNNFDDYRVYYERAHKYFGKFKIHLNEMSQIEDILLGYSLEEDLKFTASDQIKVASIIAGTAGVDTKGSAVQIVNSAARKFKVGSHTPEAWKIIGQMLKKADQASIDWDHSIFAKSTLKFMGLEE
jgi:hypothetical protein